MIINTIRIKKGNLKDSSLIISLFQNLILLKHQYLTFEQDETFGDITLYYNENNQGEEIGELSEYN